MIENKVVELIDRKSTEMNTDALYCCNSVSTTIKQLNSYIDGKINLNAERVESLLDYLVGYYTITLDIPLAVGVKILRAVKFDKIEKKPCFCEVSRLSYIPENLGIVPKIGRLNKQGDDQRQL